MSRDLLVASLAALYHDPPWKPWIITGPSRIRDEDLVSGLEEFEGLREIRHRYKKIIEPVKKKLGGHERQAVLVPLAIALKLERKNRDDLASIYYEAINVLTGENKRLYDGMKKADIYASAIDRYGLFNKIQKYSKEEDKLERRIYTRTLKYVNPFTLETLKIPDTIDHKLIVSFIEGYSEIVSEALVNTCSSMGEEHIVKCLPIMLTVGFLLLEPSWYYYTGSQPEHEEVYVPLADTRILTHTIFDHIDAVLSTLIITWNYGVGPGCISVIDLAGVQSWIQESRRLRDLWASSWLASFLGWKAIEPLVQSYGPGIMISPSARLNSFVASRILGEWLEKLGNKHEWIWIALGIDKEAKWPIHPILPGRLLVAIPSIECSTLEERVSGSISSSWRYLLKEALEQVTPICGEDEDQETCVLNDEELGALVRELEPPLAVRIYTVKPSLSSQNMQSDMLYTWYDEALQELNKLENIKISAPGRRTGSTYQLLAEKIYEKGRPANCTVCGKSIAVIDARNIKGKTIHSHSKVIVELGGDRLCPYCLVKRMLRYLISYKENFAKQLVGIRTSKVFKTIRWNSVWDHSSRMQVIRGVLEQDIPVELSNILDKYNYEIYPEAIYKLYIMLGKPPSQQRLPRKLENILLSRLQDVDDAEKEYYSKLLWSIISAALDNPQILEKTEETTQEIEQLVDLVNKMTRAIGKLFGNIPRRYAIIAADGDYMGKGLLSGKIPRGWIIKKKREDILESENPLKPASPKEYFKEDVTLAAVGSASEVADRIRKAYEDLSSDIEKIVEKQHEEYLQSCATIRENDPVSRSPKTLIVTPSFHATISRSLAVVIALDAILSTMHGAEIIYLGGDDALLVAPPMTLVPDKRQGGELSYVVRLPALDIIRVLRGNWRGTGSQYNRSKVIGFNFITYSEQGQLRVLHVAPAPGAYGRTITVHLSDAKKPMWLSIAASRRLEEAKDNSTILVNNKEIFRKDILIMSSDTRGAFIAPLSLWPGNYNSAWPQTTAKEILCLSVLSPPTRRPLSARIIHDLPLLTGRFLSYRGEASRDLQIMKGIIASTISNAINKDNLITALNMKGITRNIQSKELALKLIDRFLEQFYDSNSLLTPNKSNYKNNVVWTRVSVDNLIVNGVDYSSNRYLDTFKKDNNIIVPTILSPFGLAYIYESAVSLPEGINIKCPGVSI
ncbi:MAG: hypothetical protein GSR81_08585 [Desulfurococcales archaeon]|nr:hypothetical protein [Desulfurococcales archaeon]